MEKIFKYFPKAAQAVVSFQNPTFSPARDRRLDSNDYNHNHKPKSHLRRNFSGPIMSIIPAEARSKSKMYDTQEPTSPKVSCIGQIKHKNKIPKESKTDKISKTRPVGPKPELKRQQSTIKKIFASRRKSDASIDQNKPPIPDRVPRLSQIRRFASSRDTLAGFDWTTAQVAPADDGDLYSEDERCCGNGEDDVMNPFSAPILVGGAGVEAGGLDLEPRKEINLWKRRTTSQPKPLQLSMVRAS